MATIQNILESAKRLNNAASHLDSTGYEIWEANSSNILMALANNDYNLAQNYIESLEYELKIAAKNVNWLTEEAKNNFYASLTN